MINRTVILEKKFNSYDEARGFISDPNVNVNLADHIRKEVKSYDITVVTKNHVYKFRTMNRPKWDDMMNVALLRFNEELINYWTKENAEFTVYYYAPVSQQEAA